MSSVEKCHLICNKCKLISCSFQGLRWHLCSPLRVPILILSSSFFYSRKSYNLSFTFHKTPPVSQVTRKLFLFLVWGLFFNVTANWSTDSQWWKLSVQLVRLREVNFQLVLTSWGCHCRPCLNPFYTVWKAFVWAGIITGVAPMRVKFPGLSLGGELVLELVVDVEVGVERRSGVLGIVWT